MKKYKTALFDGLTAVIKLENFLNKNNIERENIVNISHSAQGKYYTPQIILVYMEEVNA